MFRLPLCLLLFIIPSRILGRTTGDAIPIVEESGGHIFLPFTASVTSVCSLITTTIGNNVSYIPVSCIDTAHPFVWSEEVVVDGTTAEIVISPSGNDRFFSETWLNANSPVSTTTNNQIQFNTKVTASSTARAFSGSVLSSFLSLSSSSGATMSPGGAPLDFFPSATQTSLSLSSASPSSVANSTSISTGSSYQDPSSGSGTSSTWIRSGSSYKLGANSNSVDLIYSSAIAVGVPSVTTHFTLINSSSGTVTSFSATSGYKTSSVPRPVGVAQDSSSSQLEFNPSSSPLSSSLARNISISQVSFESANNTPATTPTKDTSSITASTQSVLTVASLSTSSFPSIPIITLPPGSSASASGNFTPPISSDLDAFVASSPSLTTLSMSGQSIVLTRQTMPGFENFTGTTTVTTSEATTNSAGAVGWATGAVILGTDGVFWGLYLGSRGTGGFCIWPFCSGGKGGGGICIWPFCGGTGGGDGGGGGEGGRGGGRDGDPGDEGENTQKTQDQQTQEQKTQPKSSPTSTTTPTSSTTPKSSTTPTSTLPKSTSASTTASDFACPLFSIPSDSLPFDDSPTWNPNDPEYIGDIVSAAYAIWQVDSKIGSEIFPPLPSSTGYGDAVTIGFIPNASGDGNSTNGFPPSTTMMITPRPGVMNSAAVAASAASMAAELSASSASVASGQSVESHESVASAQSIASVQSVAAAKSVAVVNSIASAESVASVQSVISAASVASIASLPTPSSNLAILIIRNDFCDVTCSSTGYIYDIEPSSPSVSVCANPPYIHSFSYTEDASNDAQNYPINSGKFTSHGVYTNCEYQGSNDFLGLFSCDHVEAVLCSLPTEQGTSCTDSHSLDADDWVPIVYCEWVGTITATPTTSTAAPTPTTPVTCQVEPIFGTKGIVLGHGCKCSDGTKPAPYKSGKEWTCPDEVVR